MPNTPHDSPAEVIPKSIANTSLQSLLSLSAVKSFCTSIIFKRLAFVKRGLNYFLSARKENSKEIRLAGALTGYESSMIQTRGGYCPW